MQLHSCTCGCKAVLNKSQILSNNSCDIACALLKFKPGVSVKSHTGVSGRRKGNSQIHLQLSGSNSTTDWSADVKACGSIQVCNMLPPSLLSAPHRLVSLHAHYRCPSLLLSQESLASLITNLETSHLLYLFSRQDLPHSRLYPRSSIKRFIKHV